MASKYLIIARELEQRLRRGTDHTQKLPTEAALCAEFGCSRQTVRSALAVLEEKGLIVRRQGSGSFSTHAAPRGSRQIAVLLNDREEYLNPVLLRQIRKAAEEIGCTVTCLETADSWQREREILGKLLKQRPAGIILQPIRNVLGCFSEDLLLKIAQAEIPLIFLNNRYPLPEAAPCVSFDDAAGAAMLVTHLAGQGHRRIAGILQCDDSRGIDRFRGCITACRELGIDLRPENTLWYSAQERQHLLDGDNALLQRFLSTYRGDCTAVICFSDEIAFRLLRLLPQEHPGLSVVSFDNSYLSLSREASITSLGSADALPGAEAVHLIHHLSEGHPAESIVLPWQLNVRRSG